MSHQLNVPEFKPATSLDSWKTQRIDIRKTLVTLLGNIPPITTPALSFNSFTKHEHFAARNFTFDNGAGQTVTGCLLIPKQSQKKYPAIYYCHWHGDEYQLGKSELFSAAHTPEVPAERLCSEGYIVMAIDAYCFGERQGKGPGGVNEKDATEELTTSKGELWLGRSLWAMMVRDDMMALNALYNMAEVDHDRVGVTGISMGATRSWWLMALDERVRCGVAVACLTRYQNLVAEQKLRYHGIYYFVPGMLTHFDTEAVVCLIAPRPVLFMTGDEDMGSPVSGIREIDKFVRTVYRLYDADSKFGNIVFRNVGHQYTPEMWTRMVRWMNQALQL